MRRLVPTVLVLTLLVATTAAFVITERLKLQPPAISGTRVRVKIIGPTCRCEKARAPIEFRLQHGDRVTVSILDSDDRIVRKLTDGAQFPAGTHDFVWDGRDERGDIVPEGSYRPRVDLRRDRQTFVLPNPIRVDTTPPTLEANVRPTTISPDGDGHNDRVSVRYTQSEPAKPFLSVRGRVVVRALRSKPLHKLDWYGKKNGRPLPPGVYPFVIDTRDLAGNLARDPVRTTLRIRYIELARKAVLTRPGALIRIGVSTDARRFHWRLGTRTGTAARPRLAVRAPVQPGLYTLVVSERGFRSAARVIVRPR